MEPPQKRARTGEISRLFVGQLAYATTWKELKDHFSQIGDVEFANVLLKPDGASKGCGLVTYRNPTDASTAASVLHDSILDGRRIQVKLDVDGYNNQGNPGAMNHGGGALNHGGGAFHQGGAIVTHGGGVFNHGGRAPNHRGGAVSSGGVSLPPDQISRIFVGNLAFTTTWQMLKDHFRPVGSVEFVSVLRHPDGTSKGCGMVNFLTHEEALAAVGMNESLLDGRYISVKLDVDGIFRDRPPPKPMLGTAPHYMAAAAPPPQEVGHHLPPEQISRVFVGNLAFGTNWQKLKDHFTQVGEVEFASVLLNPDRTSKGCGMVNYHSHEEAMMAVELLGGSLLDGRQISVKLDVDGIFKDRPPPGSRPRTVQRTEVMDQALAAPLAQLQQALEFASPAGAPPLQVPRQSTGPMPPVTASIVPAAGPPQSNVDWLNLLGQVAQTPAAKQIDWPALILSICRVTSSSS